MSGKSTGVASSGVVKRGTFLEVTMGKSTKKKRKEGTWKPTMHVCPACDVEKDAFAMLGSHWVGDEVVCNTCYNKRVEKERKFIFKFR